MFTFLLFYTQLCFVQSIKRHFLLKGSNKIYLSMRLFLFIQLIEQLITD